MGIIKTLATATSLVGGGFGATATFLNDDGSINTENGKIALTTTVVTGATMTAGGIAHKARLNDMKERYQQETQQDDESKNDINELIATVRQNALKEEKYETAKNEVNELSLNLDAYTDEELEELYIKANLLEAEKTTKNNNKTV